MMFGWVILIILAVYFFNGNQRLNNERIHHTEGRNALDILKERYALGEIEREEFLARKKELEV